MLKSTADQYNALISAPNNVSFLQGLFWIPIVKLEGTPFHLGSVRGRSKTSVMLWVWHPVAMQLYIELTLKSSSCKESFVFVKGIQASVQLKITFFLFYLILVELHSFLNYIFCFCCCIFFFFTSLCI